MTTAFDNVSQVGGLGQLCQRRSWHSRSQSISPKATATNSHGTNSSYSPRVPRLNLEDVACQWLHQSLKETLKDVTLIPQEQLTLGVPLGRGTFAVVLRGVLRANGSSMPVAAKKLHDLPAEKLTYFSSCGQVRLSPIEGPARDRATQS